MSISTSNKCPLDGSSKNDSKRTFAALTRLLFTRLRINPTQWSGYQNGEIDF
ncbi:hypothetical protein L914_20833 [Phytophthora nicotianae]|uniref:Uncharacterized protein n=1 Tax=Phytophthora nicotianae TaxID=4792 RepID=W2M7Y1_PHYNI|nr:hypothetical protein L914_20833 [Phytophthora nicotianae]